MDPASFVEDMEVPFRMVVASKSNSGKTQLLSQIVQELLKQGKIYICFVFSNTYKQSGDWSFLPESCKSPFDPTKLRELLDMQCATPKQQRKQVLVILDDVFDDKSAVRNETITAFYTRGRHAGISCVLLSQASNHLLTPTIKENACYILYSRLNRQQLGVLWECITNMEKQEFIRFSEAINKDYNFIAIDNTVHSNNPTEFLKVVRAQHKLSR
jgi:hypothetical protein